LYVGRRNTGRERPVRLIPGAREGRNERALDRNPEIGCEVDDRVAATRALHPRLNVACCDFEHQSIGSSNGSVHTLFRRSNWLLVPRAPATCDQHHPDRERSALHPESRALSRRPRKIEERAELSVKRWW